MLCDCHIHMILDGYDWRAAIARHQPCPADDFIHRTLATYQSLGYTYLRDGGDRWGAGLRARELACEYGIRYRTPLSPLCKAGHYGAFIGETYENFKEYHALVLKMKQQGADFIKIMISGLMDFDRFGVLTQPGYPAAEIHALIHIAHAECLSVMAHCNGASAAIAAARAHCDSIEHGAYLNTEALCAMQENGTIWVPTVSTIANLRGKGRFSEPDVQRILASAEENIRAFSQIGGLIAVGSDAGAWAVPHDADTELHHLRCILGPRADSILSAGNQKIMEKF